MMKAKITAITLLIICFFSMSVLVDAALSRSVPGEYIVKGQATVSGASVRGAIPHLGLTLVKSQSSRIQVRGGSVEPNYTMSAASDPLMAEQWHVRAVKAPEAWGISLGSESTTIAVIDSGVNAEHEDLKGKIYPGFSFLRGDTDTSDVLGHGTAVAGVAAASVGNGKGGAGIAPNPKIMPLVVLDENNNASHFNVAQAVVHAVEHGARIINISLCGTETSNALEAAMLYAYNHGAVVVAASGNGGNNTPLYPAAIGTTLAVSATDGDNSLAPFSTYGTWVDVAAPGTHIITTDRNGGYSEWDGTSFAAPIVSGTLALLLSGNPWMTAQEMMNVIRATAIDMGAPGPDPKFGAGLVNVQAALESTMCDDAGQVVGFDQDYYSQAKSDQLSIHYPEWSDSDGYRVTSFLCKSGWTPESHYQAYGWREGLNPNQYFNQDEYQQSKMRQLVDTGLASDEQEAQGLLATAWQQDLYRHYLTYGFKEGINPSNEFNQGEYYAAKLAQLQRTGDAWDNSTVDDVRVVFEELGISPLEHWFRWGINEGVEF